MYLNENFDPEKVRLLAREDGIKTLGDCIINQYTGRGTPNTSLEYGPFIFVKT
ncbi:hypothetical protein [Maribacter antarcticus]|uniref:hypothetical protein n=1 Tax=Maribacter antarcticus TaxID=505250 RepID=UPI000AEEA634|nr:hypothetical protein [Maribacter antarcticus]